MYRHHILNRVEGIGLNCKTMKVEINRQSVEVDAETRTLSQLLKKENLDQPGRAVAVNNRLAPRDSWESIVLEDEMKITVIQAVCGG